jgi:hypothetical protein
MICEVLSSLVFHAESFTAGVRDFAGKAHADRYLFAYGQH